MGNKEKEILNTKNPYIKNIYKGYYKRYIDDIFLMFRGTRAELQGLMEYMNGLFPTIKFTSSYDCENRSVEYLDVKIKIRDGKITTDVYRKPMSCNTYLESTSCHPRHTKVNIAYGIALRMKMICSEEALFEKNVKNLVKWLSEKGHDLNNTLNMIDKARKMDRKMLLKKKVKIETEKSIFVYPYIPGIPSISKVLYDHKNNLDTDKELQKCSRMVLWWHINVIRIYRNFCVEQDYIQIRTKLFENQILVGIIAKNVCLASIPLRVEKKSISIARIGI